MTHLFLISSFTTTAREQYAVYLDTLGMARRAKIQTLLPQNAAVSASLTPAVNHKAVNDIVLKFLQSDTLATGNLATLESIAEMCPLEGGDAVYEARAFVAYLTGQDFDDIGICASSERQQKPQPAGKASNHNSVVFYPNPTTRQVYWKGIGDQPLTVWVFNSLGQLVAEIANSNGHVNLERLPEGLYQVQLRRQDNNIFATQKIQLIKR